MGRKRNELRTSQAAKLLGVTPTTLLRWTHQGVIPHRQLPSGHRRYDAATIEAMRTDTDIRAAEAAHILGVSPTTVMRWRKRGILPAKRLGRTLLFERIMVEELARWIAERKVQR